ncbi:MAG: hypothetical protein QOI07_3396 [Verrucomicrobiota bacterium]|jgi:hypothetical protein
MKIRFEALPAALGVPGLLVRYQGKLEELLGKRGAQLVFLRLGVALQTASFNGQLLL